MPELGIGHLGEGVLIADRGSQGRIGGRALEGGELAVGQDSEEIDDRLAVDRVSLQSGRIGRRELVVRLPSGHFLLSSHSDSRVSGPGG